MCALGVLCLLAPVSAFPQDAAQALYAKALALERALEIPPSVSASDQSSRSVTRFRRAIAAYEEVVRRYPRSGYCDNALWQAAQLALEASRRFGQEEDRRAATRLLRLLMKEYPTSPFVPMASDEAARLDAAVVAQTQPSAPKPAPREKEANEARPPPPPPEATTQPAGAKTRPASLLNVRRTVIPEAVRVTLELDHEVSFNSERIENPPRVFIDLQDVEPSPSILEGTLTYGDDLVRRVRVGRRANHVTRVVLEIEGITRYSIFTLYDPFRLVIDCERTRAAADTGGLPPSPPPKARPAEEAPAPPAAKRPSAGETAKPVAPSEVSRAKPLPLKSAEPSRSAESRLMSRPLTLAFASLPHLETSPVPTFAPERSPAAAPARPVGLPTGETPLPPAANVGGGFSLARQLGLGVSHVVIDPGHGGHDPGAKGAGITEAAVVLDVALRLEDLLLKEGVAVTLTRRGDEYVPLEDRIAIANKVQADLFLSIHANASRNLQARGVESFFLNFATSPDAEAVAARENAASGRTMNDLADILKTITLNNKISESRDFASHVQDAMAKRLRGTHRTFKDLGVKQAPFVVLIGATMPSALVEVSFITNGEEGRLLRNGSYRQRIAEALLEGIRHYQAALKSAGAATWQ